MPQPTTPVIPYNLAGELGTTWAAHVDADFQVLVDSTTEIINNLALIQRDDGGLRNQTVTADSFDSSALILMAGSSISSDVDWRPMGDWVTATLYRIGNIVEVGSPAIAYAAAVQHTSGVFATDYAAGKWVVVSAPRTLVSADITGALGYTPVNRAGDTMTGALTLTTGSSLAGMTIDSSLLSSQDLLTVNKGIYSAYNSSSAGIVYGFASNVVRDAGGAFAVGGQFSAIGAGVSATEAMFGGNINAVGLAGFVDALIGLEIDIGSFEPSNASAKRGLTLVFKNRGDGLTNPGQYNYPFPFGTYANAGSGLGANEYNKSAIAVHVDSQSRTATGEYCGWTRGMFFEPFALDSQYDAAAPGTRAYPIGIDFSELHYYGGTDPVTAFNLEAALALRDFQTIWWNRDPASPYSTSKVKTYFNPAVSRWVIDNGGVERVGFDVVTGDIYSNGTVIGSGVSLSGNNIWTAAGSNTFNGPVDFSGASFYQLGGVQMRGEFSDPVILNRAYFKASQINGATEVGALPNGLAQVSAFYLCSDSAGTNASIVRLSGDNTQAQLAVGPIGTGPTVPFKFYNNSFEVFRFQTDGKLSVGTGSAPTTGSNTRFLGPLQIDNQVAFSVNRAGVSFNVNSGAVVQVNWTAEDYDTNNSFDTGTDRFTPPAGKYLLTGTVTTSGAGAPDGTVMLTILYKNGVQHRNGNLGNVSGLANSCGSTLTAIVEANGTDFFDLRISQVNAGASVVAMSGNTYDTFFQGFKIA